MNWYSYLVVLVGSINTWNETEKKETKQSLHCEQLMKNNCECIDLIIT